MRAIPERLKQELASDPFYSKCCITGSASEKIDWHHNLMFGGSQINEKFCILPLAKSVHDKISKYKDICDWIMWNRASYEEIKRYSKAINYSEYKKILNRDYGNYIEGKSYINK